MDDRSTLVDVYGVFSICSKIIQDAYAEPGQDSRNIAGLEVVVIVQDVQDVPPIFTMAPPVTKLSANLLPGDKVRRSRAQSSPYILLSFHLRHICMNLR